MRNGPVLEACAVSLFFDKYPDVLWISVQKPDYRLLAYLQESIETATEMERMRIRIRQLETIITDMRSDVRKTKETQSHHNTKTLARIREMLTSVLGRVYANFKEFFLKAVIRVVSGIYSIHARMWRTAVQSTIQELNDNFNSKYPLEKNWRSNHHGHRVII